MSSNKFLGTIAVDLVLGLEICIGRPEDVEGLYEFRGASCFCCSTVGF